MPIPHKSLITDMLRTLRLLSDACILKEYNPPQPHRIWVILQDLQKVDTLLHNLLLWLAISFYIFWELLMVDYFYLQAFLPHLHQMI